MFSKRIGNMGIIYVADQAKGPKNRVVDGDCADLRFGEERILVRALKTIGLGRYSGLIYGFEPSYAEEYKGLSTGQLIEFDESEIFGCGSP